MTNDFAFDGPDLSPEDMKKAVGGCKTSKSPKMYFELKDIDGDKNKELLFHFGDKTFILAEATDPVDGYSTLIPNKVTPKT
jgi:hypothetical protein